MADGVTVANAFVQIMPSAEGATSAIEKAIVPGMEDAGAKAGGLLGGGLMDSLKGVAAKLGPILGAGAIAKGLFDIGSGFDEMTDNIIMGTGASGEALAGLEDVAKNVATTVPISFGQAGDYIQNLNTRLGITGQDLQDVATNVGALESMVGSVNLDSLTGTFNAFNVEAGDMTSTMDYLFGVTQSTGIGFDQLTGILEANAPSLQNLGFSLEESANMAGLLDKAGLDASGTMGKMGKALVELAGEGGDAGEAFNSLLDEMAGYIEAGDTAAAIDIASKVFGTKGAAQFVGAVQSGALALDDLKDASLGAGDGIMGTYERTADWAEKWEVLKNKFAEALAPIAGFAFDAVGAGVDMLTQAFDAMLPALEPLIETLGSVFTETVMPAAQAAVETFAPILTDLGTWFLNTATVVVGAVQGMLDFIRPTFDTILSVATDVWGGISTTIEGVVSFVSSLVEGDFQGMADAVGQIFSGLSETASSIWSGIESAISSVTDSIVSIASDAWSSVESTASSVWSSIRSAIEGPINAAKDAVGSAIDRIKGFFDFDFKWPHIPLPHFSISGSANPLDWLSGGLPSIGIEWYAKGGYVDGATLIGAGEKGGELIWPSYEPALSRYADAIARAGAGATVNNYYIDGSLVAADARLAEALVVVAKRVGGRRRMGVAR